MDILLVGGAGSLMNALIDKLNKEGHRVYVLTGQKDGGGKYRNVFEKYNFPYESDCLKEIYDSVNPQVVLFLGAYDTNYTWKDARRESVQYSAGLINLLMSYSAVKQGRFIYLSTEEVYQDSYPADIREMEPEQPKELRTLAIAQGEELCINYHRSMGVDVTILRLDHLYQPPKTKEEISEVCGRMCMSALNHRKISYNEKHSFSMLYMADVVEFIYQVIRKKEHEHTMYHVSTGAVLNEKELAVLVQKAFGLGEDALIDDTVGKEMRVVLSNEAFGREYDIHVFYPAERGVQRIAEYMRRHRRAFTEDHSGEKGFWAKLFGRTESIVKALLPFAENCICFIPFFMLNNRAVGSDYFANLDFYMLYVLLFAIVYGQQQATFSAILAVAGYCFRQAYNRSGFEVLLDYNTYVWVAQLFILGLAVGHMRDKISSLEEENKKEVHYLSDQLGDIQDINLSNVRMKNVLETQIVNQNDSFGKIYEITSSLEKYAPQEVLFYAAEVVSKLVDSKDVAIYSVANRSYARLFSATSKKARSLGNSIDYTTYTDMYECLKAKKVYINKTMDAAYPLMADAIYSEDEMQLILMVWGIPWERMTLGQANMLVIIGYLIQNAVVRANRYMEALEQQRYIADTGILEKGAFSALVHAYLVARRKELTECALIAIDVEESGFRQAGTALGRLMRQSDYLGTLEDDKLYALLSNTNSRDAEFVLKRFEDAGYTCRIAEEVAI